MSNKDIILSAKTIMGSITPIKANLLSDFQVLENELPDQTSTCPPHLESNQSQNNRPKEIKLYDLIKTLNFKRTDYSLQEWENITKLITEFAEIFDDQPSVTNMAEHNIDTGNAKPINQPRW